MIDERVRRLGFLTKAIVKECQCADASTGSLSSYAYTMMVIYFLQQVEGQKNVSHSYNHRFHPVCRIPNRYNSHQVDPPVIPVLQEVARPTNVSKYKVETWDTYFYEQLNILPSDWPTDNKDSSALLAIKFFKFYYEVGQESGIRNLCGCLHFPFDFFATEILQF